MGPGSARTVISAAVAEHHRGQGESVGIITAYRARKVAIRDYLDDQGSLHQMAPIEVGTAHSFQGREFDIVVLDNVEDGVRPGRAMRGRVDGTTLLPHPRDATARGVRTKRFPSPPPRPVPGLVQGL